ncbi:Lpg1974 family pore-forming outer membrane protein [Thermopirellula anaerolimosa]
MRIKLVSCVVIWAGMAGLVSAQWSNPDYQMAPPWQGYGGVVQTGFQEGAAPQPVPQPDVCPPACDSCMPLWQVWGEVLYLKPSDADVPWAVPIDGAITGGSVPVQVGRVANADIDYNMGFRFGVGRALDECSSVGASYTFFESHTDDAIETEAPLVLRSLVSHPATASAAADFLRGTASNDVDFQLIDADYRHVFRSSCYGSLNWLVGARYAQLEQDFSATYQNNGTENVATDIRFYGGGIRLGLEGERHAKNSGWLVYGRSAASFVAGDFRARYTQSQTFDPAVVDVSWRTGKVVPILDLELGVGWTSPSGRCFFSAGYMVSAWFNAVDADTFIRGVQANNFSDLNDTITFDGLVGRAEIRF